MPEPVDTRQRILEATYACVARWGLSKTTVEDAGREAGLSRATVYRYFPGGREELITAVVSWEFLQFFTRLYDEVRDAQSLEQVMERGLQFAHRSLAEHEVLQKVLQTDPDVLLPALTVESTRIVGVIAEFLIPYLEQHGLAEGVEPREASDFLARMIVSYMNAPGRWDLDNEVQVAALVRTELLAGIVAGPEPTRSLR
jgi:AcrR family transcriptional regulator